jgi:NAD(P)-dependent dehydrogenase (short-subunit alcohol dehydrogenase family)
MSYNPFTLEGKTILITGASSGIGKATAIECSKLGAHVIITARNEERLKETLSMMEGEGHDLIVCDITDAKQVNDLVDKLPDLHGLVNNAGMQYTLPVQFIKEDILKEILQTNTVAPIMLAQRLLKKKKIVKGGSLVFTSSVAATGEVSSGNSMYVASKGAITSFIRCAALELSARKIRVNAICPGMIETPLIHSDSISDEQLEESKKIYPLGRFGQPEEVSWAIIYLLSDATRWITGINLIIDGGISIRG